MLFFLPMASILIICGMSYISLNYKLDEFTYVLFAVGALLLMYSNIVVFSCTRRRIENSIRKHGAKAAKSKNQKLIPNITLFCKINTKILIF